MFRTMREKHLALLLLFPNIFDFFSAISFLQEAYINFLFQQPSEYHLSFLKRANPRAFNDINLNAKLLPAIKFPT